MARAIDPDWDDDDLLDRRDEQPEPRSRARLPWLRMSLLSGLSIAVLVYFALHDGPSLPSGEPKDVPASVLVAPPPMWRPLPQAGPVYGLDKAFAPATFTARQHRSGAREDTLVLGQIADARQARISLVQGLTEDGTRSFFIDIVRRAAEAGLSVARNAQSRMAPTKFGPVEMAEVTLAGATEQTCQAFRFADPESKFGFQGWLCGSDSQSIDPVQTACFIDRLSLASADNATLKGLFARAERNRTDSCTQAARTAAASVRPPLRP